MEEIRVAAQSEMKIRQSRVTKIKEAKAQAIATARKNWEKAFKEKSAIIPPETPSTSFTIASVDIEVTSKCLQKKVDMFCFCCAGQGCSECDGQNRSKSQKRSQNFKNKKMPAIADGNLTYLAEVRCEKLEVYGPKAVAAAISHKWDAQIFSSVHSVSFNFVVFDDIAYQLERLKSRFPNIKEVTFECSCLESLSQLNALGQMRGLKNLTIKEEGNPIFQSPLWKQYALYRLGPTIEQINGSMVSEVMKQEAEAVFGSLGFTASLLLPKYKLSSLLNRQSVKQVFLQEKNHSPDSLLRQPDSQLATDIIKATFTYKPDFEFSLPGSKQKAKKIVEKSIVRVHESMKKRLIVKQFWPSTVSGIICEALEDFSDLNQHMQVSMKNLLNKNKSEENLD